jgi:hypothetical protein
VTELNHISVEEIALIAEALANDRLNEIPVHIIEHVKECDQCANEVLLVSEIIYDKESLISTPTNTKKNRIIKRQYSIAASVIILMGSAILLYNAKKNMKEKVFSEDNITKEIFLAEDSTMLANDEKVEKNVKDTGSSVFSRPAPGNVLAYAENEDLEKLADRFIEGAFRGYEIEIKTENTIEIEANNNFKLEWGNDEKQSLFFELFNNRNEKILEVETIDSSIQPENLVSGLYYWKLINQDYDLIFCGKIIIK